MAPGIEYGKGDRALHKPYRIVMCGYPLETWYAASLEEKHNVFLPLFGATVEAWEALGARRAGSMCDDALRSGPAQSSLPKFFLLFDVDSLEVVAAMIEATRRTQDGVALDKFIAWDARVGRPFFAQEEAWDDDAGNMP